MHPSRFFRGLDVCFMLLHIPPDFLVVWMSASRCCASFQIFWWFGCLLHVVTHSSKFRCGLDVCFTLLRIPPNFSFITWFQFNKPQTQTSKSKFFFQT